MNSKSGGGDPELAAGTLLDVSSNLLADCHPERSEESMRMCLATLQYRDCHHGSFATLRMTNGFENDP